MNIFSPGDRVDYPKKNRRNGEVKLVFCGECGKCTTRDFSECTGSSFEVEGRPHKNKVRVLFDKIYSYHYTDLERTKPELVESKCVDEPDQIKFITNSYYLSPKDIRSLGSIILDVPLIVSDKNIVEEEEQSEEKINIKKPDFSDVYGMVFDEFLNMSLKMEHPI